MEDNSSGILLTPSTAIYRAPPKPFVQEQDVKVQSDTSNLPDEEETVADNTVPLGALEPVRFNPVAFNETSAVTPSDKTITE